MSDREVPDDGAADEQDVDDALSRRARLIARLLLAVTGLTLGLVVSELAVRVIRPQQVILIRPDLWQPVDSFGAFRRPDVDLQINTGERRARIITDEDGFRVGTEGRSEGDPKVLLLGDSYMEALQVDYEQSGAALVERGLSDALGAPVALRNAGMGGWNPDHYVLYGRSALARDDYDLVITALYMGNDVIARGRDYIPPRPAVPRARFHIPRSLSFEAFTNAFLRPVNDFLEVRSHFYLIVRNSLKTVRKEVGLSPLPFPQYFLTNGDDPGMWDLTADLCQGIADAAEARGAQSIFVLIPATFQVDSTDLMSFVRGYDLDPELVDLDRPSNRMVSELEERGLTVLDLLPDFRAAAAGGTQLFGTVDPHFSPEGNQLFADLVVPAVAEMLRSGAAGSDPEGGR